MRMPMKTRRCVIVLENTNIVSQRQAIVTLDLYIEYLRAAFNTCFYCCVITDHLEELQRKCLKHIRKPLSKSLAAELEKIANDNTANDGTEDVEKDKQESKEHREWKRNGILHNFFFDFLSYFSSR